MQTRAQAKIEGVTSKLKTPSIIDRTITPAQVSNAQKDDVSLTTTRSRCEANETIGNATFFKKNDWSYRKFSSPNVEQGKIIEQLIVPEQYRELVMRWALILQPYRFHINAIKGSENVGADYLSRV